MPFYTCLILLVLAAVGIAGMILFLIHFRSHRAMATIGLALAVFTALSLCGLPFLGGRFLLSPPIAPKNTLGGFPFPQGTTWVYTRVEYAQAIGNPDQILTATRVFTETVGATLTDAPSFAFMHERTVSDIDIPDGWWGGTVLNVGEYWFRIHGNQISSIQYPDSQTSALRFSTSD